MLDASVRYRKATRITEDSQIYLGRSAAIDGEGCSRVREPPREGAVTQFVTGAGVREGAVRRSALQCDQRVKNREQGRIKIDEPKPWG